MCNALEMHPVPLLYLPLTGCACVTTGMELVGTGQTGWQGYALLSLFFGALYAATAALALAAHPACKAASIVVGVMTTAVLRVLWQGGQVGVP